MRKFIQSVFGVSITSVRFFVSGRHVGFHWDGPDGAGDSTWCYVEPHHTTPEAYETARRKAEITAKALNALAVAEFN